jgi:nitrile hydratase
VQGRQHRGNRERGAVISRINDVGGMQGFPLRDRELNEPPFHADWEAHVFALNRALLGQAVYNLDEFRDAIERMPPQEYLASSYYEKWFHAINTLLVEKGVLTMEQINGG